MFKYNNEELLGVNLRSIVDPNDVKSTDKIFRNLHSGEEFEFQAQKMFLQKTQQKFIGLLKVSSINIGGNNFMSIIH
jgi:hypothetical protein